MREFIPHKYQLTAINHVINVPKCGLFLDMGLGKTVSTLTAIKELKYNRFQVNKVLIIAPKKVAEGTWSKEKDKWNHTKDFRVSLVLGSQQKRIKALSVNADLYIINRENIQKKCKYDMIILHPLPRVDEISTDLDDTKHALYFKQARNGIPVRQAMMMTVLGKVKEFF